MARRLPATPSTKITARTNNDGLARSLQRIQARALSDRLESPHQKPQALGLAARVNYLALAAMLLAPGIVRRSFGQIVPVTAPNGDDSYAWNWMGTVDNDFVNSDNWEFGYEFPGAPALGYLPVQLGPIAHTVNSAFSNWQLPVNFYPLLSQSIASPYLTLVSYDQINSLTLFNGANYAVSGVVTVGCSYLAAVTSLLPPGEPVPYNGSYPGGSPIAASLTQNSGSALTCSTLYIGYDTEGRYTLNGTGLLTVNGLEYMGSGTFTQNGGVHAVAGMLRIANSSGSSGNFNLSGAGTLSVGSNMYVGYDGTGTLNITNGGQVNCSAGYSLIGFHSGSTGTVTVDGTGSTWITTNLRVGIWGTGTLNITNGGRVNSIANTAYPSATLFCDLGVSAGSTGTVAVDGAGSIWTNTSYINIGESGTGILTITRGGRVTANGVSIGSNSLLAINVGDASALNTGTGNLYIGGTLRLAAGPGATAGTYTPITATRWLNYGTVQALGGSWNAATHQFTVAAPSNGITGQATTFDLYQTQRVIVTDPTSGHVVEAGFQATTATSSLSFTASLLTAPQSALLATTVPASTAELAGWTFTGSGYTTGSPVFLSVDIGSGYPTGNLSVWHYDGTTWTPFASNDLSYDGQYANFTVMGFGGYAVVAVPGPTSLGVLGIGLVEMLVWRRRRRAATG